MARLAVLVAALSGCVREHDLAHAPDVGATDVGARDSGSNDAGRADVGPADVGDEVTECEAMAGARCVALDEGGQCPSGAAPIEARCAATGDESSVVCCLD
jgi:hypothetical protein